MGEPAVLHQSLVLHQDALDSACQAASLSVDQLLWQGSAHVAKAVTLFGPGLVVLPILGRVCGVDESKCLAYEAHPKRAAKGGLMDRLDLETKFGQLDPSRLMQELRGGGTGLDRRLRGLSNGELRDEVLAFQDWRTHANGRLKTLERRAAWALLGMAAGSADQAAVRRAFKRKALELHPDKGGDAERFQLLQEMKELLIVRSARESEELEKERKEKEKEVGREKDKAKERKAKEEEEVNEDDDAELSSDDSWDADEELRKMFPKKPKRRKPPREEEEDPDLLSRDEDFNRDKYEAARRKLHRNLVDLWDRAGRLAEEIGRSPAAGSGGDALRHLRKFVDRFANLEVSKLTENDPQKAERIFRRFLEQGSEVLCAAGAVDPVATVSTVAMQVNYPLMATAPSDSLKDRCARLLDAITSLPSLFEKYVRPIEDARCDLRPTAAPRAPVRIQLLVPDPDVVVKGSGVELPGVSKVAVELPPGSDIADLRAAALHLCGGRALGTVAPRLFCHGRFIGEADDTLLFDVPALRAGFPVQCLPSNVGMRPRSTPLARAACAAEQACVEAGEPRPAAASAPGAGAAAQLQLAAQAGPGMDAPLEAEVGAAVKGACCDGAAPRAAAAAEAAPAIALQAAEGEAAEGKAADEPEEEEDPWFDEFFSPAAPAAAEAEAERAGAAAEAEREAVKKEGGATGARAQAGGRKAGAAPEPAVPCAAVAAAGRRREVETQAIVAHKEEVLEISVVRSKTCWDSNWEHPFAGERRPDGSAVFCYPCNDWIQMGKLYEHREFERHSDKVGHYGWID